MGTPHPVKVADAGSNPVRSTFRKGRVFFLKGGSGEDNAGMVFPQNFSLDCPAESVDNKYDLRGVQLSPKRSKG